MFRTQGSRPSCCHSWAVSRQSFAVTVDEVEQKTGLNFFSELPKEQQEALESTITINAWKWQ